MTGARAGSGELVHHTGLDADKLVLCLLAYQSQSLWLNANIRDRAERTRYGDLKRS